MSKPGRNDACPCGSGKKLKRCCIARVEEERRIAQLEVQNEQLRAKSALVQARVEHARARVEQLERLLDGHDLADRS